MGWLKKKWKQIRGKSTTGGNKDESSEGTSSGDVKTGKTGTKNPNAKRPPENLSAEDKIKWMYKEFEGRDEKSLTEMEIEQKKNVLKNEGEDFLLQDFATANRKRGFNPADYGAYEVDPATLDEKVQPFYDEWRKHNQGKAFTNVEAKRLKWREDWGSIDAYRELNKGTIKEDARAVWISDEALKAFGDPNLAKHFTGTRAGTNFVYSSKFDFGDGQGKRDVFLKGDTFGDTTKMDDYDGSGQVYTSAHGNLRSGLLGTVGKAIGVKELENPIGFMRKTLGDVGFGVVAGHYALSNPLVMFPTFRRVAFGARGMVEENDMLEKAGINVETFRQVEQAGEAVAKAVAIAATGGVAAVAITAADQLAQAAAAHQMRTGDEFDWGNAVVAVGGAAVGAGFQAVGASARTGAALRGLSQATLNVAGQAINGGSIDWGEVAESGVRGTVAHMELLPAVAGFDPLTTGYDLAKAAKDKNYVSIGSTLGQGAFNTFVGGTDLIGSRDGTLMDRGEDGKELSMFSKGAWASPGSWSGTASTKTSGRLSSANPLNAQFWWPHNLNADTSVVGGAASNEAIAPWFSRRFGTRSIDVGTRPDMGPPTFNEYALGNMGRSVGPGKETRVFPVLGSGGEDIGRTTMQLRKGSGRFRAFTPSDMNYLNTTDDLGSTFDKWLGKEYGDQFRGFGSTQ